MSPEHLSVNPERTVTPISKACCGQHSGSLNSPVQGIAAAIWQALQPSMVCSICQLRAISSQLSLQLQQRDYIMLLSALNCMETQGMGLHAERRRRMSRTDLPSLRSLASWLSSSDVQAPCFSSAAGWRSIRLVGAALN